MPRQPCSSLCIQYPCDTRVVNLEVFVQFLQSYLAILYHSLEEREEKQKLTQIFTFFLPLQIPSFFLPWPTFKTQTVKHTTVTQGNCPKRTVSEGLWLGFIFLLSTEQHFLNVSVVGKVSQPFPLVDDGVIRAVKKEPMTLKGYKCCRFRTTGFYGNRSENRTLNGWITII